MRLSLSSTLFLVVLIVIGLAATWIFASRPIILVLDQIATAAVETLPANSFVYSQDAISVGAFPGWTNLPDGQSGDFYVAIDVSGRLVLHAGKKSFPLGVRIGPPDVSGRLEIPFARDADDQVALIVERSLLAWPTPLDSNFMTGRTPSWRRNLYYRLSWRKRSGSVLNMVWRYEQGFYADDGWSSWMIREGATGLIHIDVVDIP